MRVLCITDQFEDSNHSSVEGIFGAHLKEMCDVHIVYFSKTAARAFAGDRNKLYIPYRFKRKGVSKALGSLLDMNEFDIVIVRNFFPVLRDMLGIRTACNFRVGFWHSFPHTFRRLFEAREEGKAVLRKTIEFKTKTYLEKKLVRECDFLITMSGEFKGAFYPDLVIPHLALPMGVSFEGLPPREPRNDPAMKLIYTGTVDHLRKTDLIIEAASELESDFILDIFTHSNNAVTRKIKEARDRRIRIHPALPRSELFRVMASYDLGIGLIPDNELYHVSSPTKTLEYYSIGLPALINYLPEYVALFDEKSAFFCDFTKESVQRALRRILSQPYERLQGMGARGREAVKKNRDYRKLSEKLYNFLRGDRMERTVI